MNSKFYFIFNLVYNTNIMPQIGASDIVDLDEGEVDQITGDLDNMINEIENSEQDEVVIESKENGNPISSKLGKNAIDALIVFVLIFIFSNKVVLTSLFKIPFLVKFESNVFIPALIVSFIVSIFYFIVKYFM